MYSLFLFNDEDRIGNKIIVRGEESHHIKVLRIKIGEEIFLANGKGLGIRGVLIDRKDNDYIVEIKEEIPEYGESSSDLAICMGITDKDRMEWFVEKATELGVKRIVPLRTDNTDISARYKKERLLKKIKSAVKQCHRSRLPILEDEMNLFEAYDRFADNYEYRCSGIIGTNRWHFDRKIESAIVFIGPPGDFSKKEKEFLLENTIPLDLGETLLRSETASVVAITRLLIRR